MKIGEKKGLRLGSGAVLGMDLGLRAVLKIYLGLGLVWGIGSEIDIANYSHSMAHYSPPSTHSSREASHY